MILGNYNGKKLAADFSWIFIIHGMNLLYYAVILFFWYHSVKFQSPIKYLTWVGLHGENQILFSDALGFIIIITFLDECKQRTGLKISYLMSVSHNGRCHWLALQMQEKQAC